MPRVPALGASLVALALALASPGALAKSKKKAAPQLILLDGAVERVNWNDGDSFRITKGAREGQKARLVGYNTLESYGPVHFWGGFNGWELYRTHKAATALAKSQQWVCSSNGTADGYGRILVDCPELRKTLVAEGLAHVYQIEGDADPELLAIQMKAQNERKGMWAKGIPQAIITSVHSIDEKDPDHPDEKRTESYNRLCDTRTGKTYAFKHSAVLKPCDVFCKDGSCMVYVPFDHRYGKHKVACLKGEGGERNRMSAAAHLHQPIDPYDKGGAPPPAADDDDDDDGH
ncbi:MAG: thermonuclease family protein [Myxococcales bacterium]|nr:thermonuclease family protein [Myxococcales bacterium]MCB9733262.1 thermonuclease family protein [Deltaproteobacteria bacterium]